MYIIEEKKLYKLTKIVIGNIFVAALLALNMLKIQQLETQMQAERKHAMTEEVCLKY